METLKPDQWQNISYEIDCVPLSENIHTGEVRWFSKENHDLIGFVNNKSVYIISYSNDAPNFNYLVFDLNEYVTNIAVHPEGTFVAVSLMNKQLLMIDLNSKTPKDSPVILFKMNMPKKTSVIKWENCNHLLIADKFGDLTLLDLRYDASESPLKITCIEKRTPMGHYSILTNLLVVETTKLNEKCKFLITSDKDEKIRISNWPNSYEIESFCLAHTQFVSKIILIQNENYDCLMSSGGDGKIILWNYIKGTILSEICLNDCVQNIKPLNGFDCLVVNSMVFLSKSNVVAFSLECYSSIHFLKLTTDGQVKMSYLNYVELPIVVTSMKLDTNQILWVAGVSSNPDIKLIVADVLYQNENASLITKNSFMKEIGQLNASYELDNNSIQKIWNNKLKKNLAKKK